MKMTKITYSPSNYCISDLYIGKVKKKIENISLKLTCLALNIQLYLENAVLTHKEIKEVI